MPKNTAMPALRRPYQQLDETERTNLDDSVRRLLAAAREMPHERTRALTLKIALFQLTEDGGPASRKFAARYRTRAAVFGPEADLQHEHVVARDFLAWALTLRPDLSGDVLPLAVACVTTVEEHRSLATHAESFGWKRYLQADVEVLDAARAFAPADLDELAERQRVALDKLHADIGERYPGPRRNRRQ
jgi:hypothetical protein